MTVDLQPLTPAPLAPVAPRLTGVPGLDLLEASPGFVKARQRLAGPRTGREYASVSTTLLTMAEAVCGYGASLEPTVAAGAVFKLTDVRTHLVDPPRVDSVVCVAVARKLGATEQLWDVFVSDARTRRPLGFLQCTLGTPRKVFRLGRARSQAAVCAH